ncbi:MAG: hypothetical protein HY291_07075 [Planctomycetes bacterium]|nr:hypothetical protein [Planctomycetota bacterium]
MLEDYRRWSAGCGLLLLLVLAGMYASVYLWRPAPPEMGDGYGDEEGPLKPEELHAPPKPPTAREQISELENKQRFDDAVALCERFIKDGQQESRDEARARLPRLLDRQFDGYLRGKAYGQAQSTLMKMAALGVTAFGDGQTDAARTYKNTLENMQERWKNEQRNRMSEAVRSGVAAVVDALAAELAADPAAELTGHEFLTFQMERWKEARAAGRTEEATKRLRFAAEVAAGEHVQAESWGFERSAVEEMLRKTLSSDELLDEGKRLLAKKDYTLAACYLLAFREPQNPAVPKKREEIEAWWLERLQRKMLGYEALLGLAQESAHGTLRWLPPDEATNRVEVLLSIVRASARDIETFDKRALDPKEKYRLPEEAWQAQFAAFQDKMTRLIRRGDYMRAESLGRQVLTQDAKDYQFYFRVNFLKCDPWTGVPAELRERIEKKTKDPPQQLAELMQAATTGEYTPDFPGKEALVDQHATATARNGIAMLEDSPGVAYSALREVLRRAPKSTAAEEVRQALFKAIRKARDEKNFSKLYQHAGVFIGELGRAIPAEFREELAGCLQTAADYYKNGAPMSRAFMLSLLADVLAGDPRGQAAADEALRLGFEAVAKIPMETPHKPDLTLPSTLSGYSIVGLDNATEYHLMVFYDGPEKFFARINPYRRGSAVLKDGAYTTAVIVTSESVRPYRAQVNYQKEYAQHRYVIVAEGERNNPNYHRLGDFLGDYTLLRTPSGVGNFEIEPKTGFVIKK